jgi:Rieske Fe-S protein
MIKLELSRREFLAAGGTAASAAVLFPVLTCSPATAPASFTIDITTAAYTALQTVDGQMYVTVPGQAGPVIVRRTAQSAVEAYSSTCTHQGCKVPLPVDNVITCGCHLSQFDGHGNLLRGPAAASLTKFTATLNGNIISIET